MRHSYRFAATSLYMWMLGVLACSSEPQSSNVEGSSLGQGTSGGSSLPTGGTGGRGDEAAPGGSGQNTSGASETGGVGGGGASAGGPNAGGVSMGGSATGGTSTGGNDAGGMSAGGSDAGGMSTGGTDTAGTSAGGNDAGGMSAGGNDAGGMSAGGTDTAGTNSGGTNMGGTNMGGTSSGGTAAGGTGTGGSATGGLPSVPDNGCNVRLTDTPIGFAAQDAGTVGGGDATPILVTTEAELESYLSDNEPRVLYVMNDLDFRTENRDGVQTCNENTTCDNGSGAQIEEPRVSATCDPNEHAATSYRYETRLDVASNKTLIGIGSGSGAALRGASFNVGSSQQIIIRNLRIYDVNPHLVEAGDGLTLQGSRYVWLDHLLLEQISDGYVDIGSANHDVIDQNVTLSWIHFNGRTTYQCGGKHHYVNAIDNSQVTYHHDWYDNCNGRNPKIGQPSSRVHLFNNYWLDVTYFCITAQTDGQARVESNYFENSSRPHWLQTDGNGTAGIAIDDGNVYTGASSGNTNRDTGGTVFNVPYSYSKESADAARQNIIDCSGPQPIR